jgi:hypothetical protein
MGRICKYETNTIVRHTRISMRAYIFSHTYMHLFYYICIYIHIYAYIGVNIHIYIHAHLPFFFVVPDQLVMIEVPCPTRNCEGEEREKGWEGAGCGYVSCKHTRQDDKCKFTHLRIGTYCSTYYRTRKTKEQDGTESESPKKNSASCILRPDKTIPS